MNRHDVIIIGGGIIGLWSAYYLVKRGIKPIIFEQFKIGEGDGASTDESRVFRLLDPDPYLAKLTKESLSLWKDLEREGNVELLDLRGVLMLGDSDSNYLEEIKIFGINNKAKFSLLTLEDLKANYPYFKAEQGLLDPSGGIIRSLSSIKALKEMLLQKSVKIYEECTVNSWSTNSVSTNKGIFYADKIILAGGALLEEKHKMSKNIAVTLQPILYFKIPKSLQNTYRKIPVFGYIDKGFYGFPDWSGNGVKVSTHIPGINAEENYSTEEILSNFEKDVRNFFKEHIPQLKDAEVSCKKICRYDLAEKRRFIFEEIKDNVFIATGFSGGGFKYSPRVGELVADRLVDTC